MKLLNGFHPLPLHFYSVSFWGFKPTGWRLRKAFQQGTVLGNRQQLGWKPLAALGFSQRQDAICLGFPVSFGHSQHSVWVSCREVPSLCVLSWKERKLHWVSSAKKEKKLFLGCSCGPATDFSLEAVYWKLLKLLFFTAWDVCTNRIVHLFILVFCLTFFLHLFIVCLL